MLEESDSDQENNHKPAHCVWVLAASPIWSGQESVDWLPRPDRVVAADGGSSLAARLGVVPDLVIGDLDSSPPSVLAELEASSVEVRRYAHDTKWETDTELAVLAALQWRPDTIILLGGVGGRLDHTLANVLLLTHPKLAEVDVRVIEGRQEVSLAKPGRWNAVNGKVGDTVTLLPVGGDAEGVSTQDLLFPLKSEPLLEGRGRGVSNQVSGPNPQVWLDGGQLLIVVLRIGA